MRVGQEGRARDIGLISSSESALIVTYGNVVGGEGGRKLFACGALLSKGELAYMIHGGKTPLHSRLADAYTWLIRTCPAAS